MSADGAPGLCRQRSALGCNAGLSSSEAHLEACTAADSTNSRVQGSCAELTSPAWSTVTPSPSSARLSSKMQRLHLLCLGLLVLGRILDVHGGNNVLDCCLRTSETPIPRRIVQNYELQLVQDGCNIPATVFITTRGKRLCAPLQAPWVVRLQEKIDASSARKAKPQGK
ncbi:C-C motif chemokine 19 [Egretta garzetta]|uniref:C-C motif chemokine 19 n=1 Tax=Egretta garzetta TaxID=188379 RepID=UPI00163BD258|nr:C-C motif chemokine 19 [Egretta garzetta]